MRGRITGLTAIVLLLFGLILGQAVFVQIHRAAALNANPLNPRVSSVAVKDPRGPILASNGVALARSIRTRSSTYPWRRSYPLGRLTSDIIGYNSIKYGTFGLEQEYNSYLVSHTQPPKSLEDLLSPKTAFDTVSLTLNVTLQQIADRALAGRVGAVVALDPRNGSVLAMFSNPTFDPAPLTSLSNRVQDLAREADQARDSDGFQALNNVATQETFPPGSTFKVVTTSAIYRYYPALANVQIPYRTCLSLKPYSDKTLCNSGYTPCGGNVQVMLPASCDPGYGQLGIDLGGQFLYNEATQFGYNEVPPIDLPLANASAFPSLAYLSKGGPPSLAYSAIGQQEVRSTALQGALVAAAIADGGLEMTPHLLRFITNEQGAAVVRYKPSVWHHPLGKVEASEVTTLMHAVVTSGTASGVGFLYQDDVAAKTGTAQTSLGTVNLNTDDWMIAFAPASAPVVAIAVVVPNQALYDFGATIAGPIVKCMVEGALAIDAGQPPTNTYTTCAS
ncbi:MAG TPA: penicillin-binding transpeptidase domain-containing protein [Acidimicrobiales bacterium]|jgi:peptidoglycan glycosyltransferase|nr:penicillin-binding transpeptidase domain-containing protein [Acidimicrobiales bacterium]